MSSPGKSNSPDLEAAFAAAPSPYALIDRDFVYVWVNRAYAALSSRPEGDLIGRSALESFPGGTIPDAVDGERSLRHSLARVLATGEPDTFAVTRRALGSAPGTFDEAPYWAVTSSAVTEGDRITGILIHAENVTGSIEAVGEDAPGDGGPPRAGTVAAVDNLLQRSLVRLGALNDLGVALVGVTSIDDLAAIFCAPGALGAGPNSVRMAVADQGVTRVARLVDDGVTWDPAPAIDPDPTAYPKTTDTDDGTEVVIALGADDTTVATLRLHYDPGYEFTSTDRLIYELVAGLGSDAIAACLLHSEQSETLESVSEALLHSNIEDPVHAEVHGLYRPATTHTTAGGDWFDQLQLEGERVLLVIGDVADHGATASGEMARAKATIQAHALESASTDVIATKASAAIRRFAGTLATAVIALYDPATELLSWTTAGHPFPLMIPASGPARFLEGTHGPPLGTGLAGRYTQSSCRLERGDTVVFYTDGLIERPGELIDTGLERLRAVAQDVSHSPDLAEDLFARLVPDEANADDVAMLVARIT
ncbi:MAG: SpoIIE family protein phosphatase [Acidimicrobiales bacterium]|nr:SpoIIE family protein phosphatase [Acidimicrobiales bacterium]